MSPARLTAALLGVALLLGACAAPGPPGDAARVDARLLADLGEDDARAIGEAVNAFGFDLLGELTDGSENAVTSPLSVALLTAMVLAGAGGETAEAIAATLHLDDARDRRVGALLRDVADTDDVTLSVANGLWAAQGAPFEDDYLSFVRDTFGATVEESDLGAQQTADELDAWVDERTEGLIDEIAEDLRLPNPQAVLVLLNAVYFLGQWSVPFDPHATVEEPFTLADGAEVTVPLMRLRAERFGHAERDGYRMLRLPYGDDGRFGMELVLPDQGVALADVLATLDAGEWRAAAGDLVEREVDELVLPRFELDWGAELNEPLERLGMGVAFGPEADFRPMSPNDPWLDVVVHKTHIRVDEEGTEAAAVTGGVAVESAPLDPLVFRVDRPFAFAVSDARSGALLFLGAVTDPRG